MSTVNLQVSASADDAQGEQDVSTFSFATSNVNASSVAVSGDRSGVGLRFQNVAVPQGAVVLSATLRVYVTDTTRDDPNLAIYAEDTDDAAAFANSSGARVWDRTATTAYVDWIATGLAAGSGGYKTAPDLTAPVQEVINRAGWSSGNDLALLLLPYTGAGETLRFHAYDLAAANAATLDIVYADETAVSTVSTATTLPAVTINGGTGVAVSTIDTATSMSDATPSYGVTVTPILGGLGPTIGVTTRVGSVDSTFDAVVSPEVVAAATVMSPLDTAHYFQPPIVRDQPRTAPGGGLGNRVMRHFGMAPRGVNIYKLTDGTVSLRQPASWDDVEKVWWGGHLERVTAEEAEALAAAGLTVLVA